MNCTLLKKQLKIENQLYNNILELKKAIDIKYKDN